MTYCCCRARWADNLTRMRRVRGVGVRILRRSSRQRGARDMRHGRENHPRASLKHPLDRKPSSRWGRQRRQNSSYAIVEPSEATARSLASPRLDSRRRPSRIHEADEALVTRGTIGCSGGPRPPCSAHALTQGFPSPIACVPRSGNARNDLPCAWQPRPASKVRRVNRITWSVPVPTAFGLDPEALPPGADGVKAEEGETGGLVRQGFRRLAVAPYNGLPQVRNRAGGAAQDLPGLGFL